LVRFTVCFKLRERFRTTLALILVAARGEDSAMALFTEPSEAFLTVAPQRLLNHKEWKTRRWHLVRHLVLPRDAPDGPR
jgi:hypothetical protein